MVHAKGNYSFYTLATNEFHHLPNFAVFQTHYSAKAPLRAQYSDIPIWAKPELVVYI
jgi:hypothetical protein